MRSGGNLVLVLVSVAVLVLAAGCMNNVPDSHTNDSVNKGSPNTGTSSNGSDNSNVAAQEGNRTYNESLIQTKPSPLADQIIPKREIISRHNISALEIDEINLYYIDSDHNWWFADYDGTILAPAPSGNGTVVAGTTIPAKNRNGEYVWKIRIGSDRTPPTLGGAYTAAVNATNGEIFFEIETP